MPLITYREALRAALDEEILRDENVVVIGEEVAQYNGAYKVTEGLWATHGDTPPGRYPDQRSRLHRHGYRRLHAGPSSSHRAHVLELRLRRL